MLEVMYTSVDTGLNQIYVLVPSVHVTFRKHGINTYAYAVKMACEVSVKLLLMWGDTII
jgi:hypothetical protein